MISKLNGEVRLYKQVPLKTIVITCFGVKEVNFQNTNKNNKSSITVNGKLQVVLHLMLAAI